MTVIVQEKPWGTHYRLKAYVKESREQFNFITDLTICDEFIADLENVLTSHDDAVLNTNQAAAMTGYVPFTTPP